MRYTKIALLTFGAGLVLGLVIVVAELDRFDRLASGLMAVGLALIPIGMAADWRRAAKTARRPAKRRAKAAPRRRSASPAQRPRRARKPAPRKR